jgi:hypothetical protein
MSSPTLPPSLPPLDEDAYAAVTYDASPDVVGLAAVAIWAYLIPHIYIEYSEYKLALRRSSRWGGWGGTGHAAGDDDKAGGDDGGGNARAGGGAGTKGAVRALEASRGLVRTLIWHSVLGTILYVGTAALISWLTTDMDRRAGDIVTGASRLFAGVVIFVLSVKLAQWLGLYYSVSRQDKMREIATARSVREICFAFAWSLWRHLLSLLFFNLYFSCWTARFTYLYGFLSKWWEPPGQ